MKDDKNTTTAATEGRGLSHKKKEEPNCQLE
jgi:hypothetical protein